VTDPDATDDPTYTPDPSVQPVEIVLGSDGDSAPSGGQNGQTSSTDDVGATGDDLGDAETFPRSYVEQLRKENAEQRQRAKNADKLRDDLLTGAIQGITNGIIFDPTDLPVEPEFWDEETDRPNYERIRDAAVALAERKPYLARARGRVGQGRQPEPETGVSLHDIMRRAAG
jgi:hypothetical protein